MAEEIKLVQKIENGKIPENTSSSTTKRSEAQKTKDMFLQLLVAEMKYQDPMEPTDNSEYVKELATFSQVESMQAMQDDVNAISVKSLTGKYVVLNAEMGNKEGYVDFVKTDASGTKVSIDGVLYEASAVEQVMDETYHNAITAKNTLAQMVKDLPTLDKLTASDEDYKKVVALNTLYTSLDAYQKSMINADDQKTIEKYINRMAELVKAKEASSETTQG